LILQCFDIFYRLNVTKANNNSLRMEERGIQAGKLTRISFEFVCSRPFDIDEQIFEATKLKTKSI
jgi:hypothetical protein